MNPKLVLVFLLHHNIIACFIYATCANDSFFCAELRCAFV